MENKKKIIGEPRSGNGKVGGGAGEGREKRHKEVVR